MTNSRRPGEREKRQHAAYSKISHREPPRRREPCYCYKNECLKRKGKKKSTQLLVIFLPFYSRQVLVEFYMFFFTAASVVSSF